MPLPVGKPCRDCQVFFQEKVNSMQASAETGRSSRRCRRASTFDPTGGPRRCDPRELAAFLSAHLFLRYGAITEGVKTEFLSCRRDTIQNKTSLGLRSPDGGLTLPCKVRESSVSAVSIKPESLIVYCLCNSTLPFTFSLIENDTQDSV